MMELDDLFRERRSLEYKIVDFFSDDDTNPNYGDRGYQDLLERLEDVNDNINELQVDGSV